jgi:hypothetical protein
VHYAGLFEVKQEALANKYKAHRNTIKAALPLARRKIVAFSGK